MFTSYFLLHIHYLDIPWLYMSAIFYYYIKAFGDEMLYRNAPLVLTKMLRALMNIFAHHVPLIFFPTVLISYTWEVILLKSLSLSLSHFSFGPRLTWEHFFQEEYVSHHVPINVYPTSIGCQIAIHLLRSWCILLGAPALLHFCCHAFWCF